MTERENNKSLMLEDVRLLFRNFAGIAREFNSEGDRNFSVLLPPDVAKKMLDEGWRVKQLKPRTDEEEGDYHIKVTVNYKSKRPPKIVMISSQGRTELGPDEVGIMDYADIKKVDVALNGWWSDMAGGGYGAFLKSAFITIEEDELDLKYAELPTTSNSTVSEGTQDASELPWDADSEYAVTDEAS